MDRGPQPTLLVTSARPGREVLKLPNPARELRGDDEDTQVTLVRGTDHVWLAPAPALAGLDVGHSWPRGAS